MKVAFANSALESARDIAARPAEASDMASLLASLRRAADPAYLHGNPDVVSLADGPADKVFVVRRGRVRALVTIDPTMADLVVAKVYVAAEDETVKIGAEATDAADIAHAH